MVPDNKDSRKHLDTTSNATTMQKKHHVLSGLSEADFVGTVQGSAQPSLLCYLFRAWGFVFVGVWSVVSSLGQRVSLFQAWRWWVWVRCGLGQG